MEDSKLNNPKIFTAISAFIKRFWLFLLSGIIVIVAISYALFHYAVSNGQQADVQQSLYASTSTDLVSSYTSTSTKRRLDGLTVDENATKLLPYAVMIEQHPDARPLSGVSKASVVFESPVEGGITRLMAVFDASTTVDKIGPVRSARPYFVEWAQGLNALYAHVGGSPEALNRIGGMTTFRNLDEMANSKYFWRADSRTAPHNVYTSSKMLTQAAEAKDWSPADFDGWLFKDARPDEPVGDVQSLRIPYGGSYNITWNYNQSEDVFERYIAGAVQKDMDGTPYKAKNVVILFTDQKVLDDVGRLQVRTTGSGRALLFSRGFAKELRWSRVSGAFVKFETPDGRPASFYPGITWIEVVTLPSIEPIIKMSSATP